ncbi:MAG: aminoacetone oxidase family FAD-binding enzyme [Bacilli bacterium]|nr:aminoacetone oxidase family FAD-binding enzyme [Bacilli bacterium]
MKVIIIGGGASGVMHALYLRSLKREVDILILEKNDRILKKLMKTGNGRCNISNKDMDPKFYNHYNFIKELYNEVKPSEVLDYFKGIGLLLKNDNSTRLYPYSESAKTVIDTLRYELDKGSIEIKCDQEVIDIIKKDRFSVITKSDKFQADYVVVASGSIAQETTNLYDVLKRLGHSITKLEPGLVALKVEEDTKSLQGIRVKCKASVINDDNVVFFEEGEILFKDKGLSGVLVLNLSRHVNINSIISIDLFSDYKDIDKYILSFIGEKNILDILGSLLPKMLAMYIVKTCNYELGKILKTIHDLRFKVVGNYGFNQGQIVLGGVAMNDINKDFSSKIIEDLYLIGEVLDIDGSSGGYNLHFAWASGIISARSIFEKNL